MMDAKQVKNILEACLLVAGKAMSLRQLDDLFDGDDNRPDKDTIKACLEELQTDYTDRGIELVQVASGYRLQSRADVSDWVARLFPEKPPRYSRALLETLVLVAYRQPITRGEIEEIRGVAVSSNIIKTLQERQWVKEVGFKDVPGKPALLGTTKLFLDYFNLKRLDDLPPLSDIKNLDEMDTALMEAAGIAPAQGAEAANDNEEREQPSSSSDNAEQPPVDGQVYGAGEAGAVEAETNVDLGESGPVETQIADSEKHEESDGVSADATGSSASFSDEDSPVTFAGLLSRLPNSEESEVASNDANDNASNDANNNVNVGKSDTVADKQSIKPDSEVRHTESAEEQPSAEETLLSSVAEFADEHRQEIEARDELENQLKTRYMDTANEENVESIESEPGTESGKIVATEDSEPVIAGDDELTEKVSEAPSEASSTSPDVLSDTFVGDTPGAGDTLH